MKETKYAVSLKRTDGTKINRFEKMMAMILKLNKTALVLFELAVHYMPTSASKTTNRSPETAVSVTYLESYIVRSLHSWV